MANTCKASSNIELSKLEQQAQQEHSCFGSMSAPNQIRSPCAWGRLDCSRITGSPDHRTTGSQDHRTTGPQDHRTTGPQDHRTTGPQDHRTTGPQDHRTTGPPDHRTTGPQDHRTTGPPDHRTTEGTRHHGRGLVCGDGDRLQWCKIFCVKAWFRPHPSHRGQMALAAAGGGRWKVPYDEGGRLTESSGHSDEARAYPTSRNS